MSYYHLTRRNLGEVACLDPSKSHPGFDMLESDKSVCLAPSIESAYLALPESVSAQGYGFKYKVYYVYSLPGTAKLLRPEVDDIDYTEERRSREKVRVVKKGKIRVLRENPFQYEWI